MPQNTNILDSATINGVSYALRDSDTRSRVCTETLECMGSGPLFTIDGVTLSPTSLQYCHYVVKFTHPATTADGNGQVRLSIGGNNCVMYFEGSQASITNTWQAGDFLDIIYHGGIWYANKTNTAKISYEVWADDVEGITRPSLRT